MRLTQLMAKVDRLAKKAGVSFKDFVATGIVIEEDQQLEEQARRASDEEKLAITAFAEQLDGAILDGDITADDLLHKAGIRQIQGTRMVATREIKRLRLMHTPPVAA